MKNFKFDALNENLSIINRYLLAVALAILAVGLRAAVLPAESGAKYTTFYPAVIMAFYLCGNGPGIITIIVTTLAADFFFLPPYNSFKITPEGFRQTLLYLLAAGFCGYFINRMHQYRRASLAAQKAVAQEKLHEASENLSLAVNGARLGVWRFHPDARLVSFSERFAEHFGLPVGVTVVSYDKILYLIHPDDRDAVDAALEKAIRENTDFVVEHRVTSPDGSERWVYGHGRPIFSANGALERIDGITMDLTERKRSDKNYKESAATIRAAFDSMNEAIILADAQGNVTGSNTAAAQFFRYKGDQIFKTYREFTELFDVSTLDGKLHNEETHPYDLALKGVKGVYELRIRRKDTGETWYALTGTCPIMDEQKNIIGTASTGLDITDRIMAREKLEDEVKRRTEDLATANRALMEISRHDALTGLHNRLAANERLRSEFERMKRTEQDYSVLMIDIDLFKNVNDSCGHAIGDGVLRMVADALAKDLREYDFIARWGGEEFLILLPATDCEQACVVAEKLRSAVAERSHPIAGAVTVSVGVATASPEDIDEDYAVMKADEALYEAKKSGRDRVVARLSLAASLHGVTSFHSA